MGRVGQGAVGKSLYRSVLGLHTALASPSGRGPSRREGERDVQTVGGGMQFVWGIGAVDRWVVGGGIGAVSPLRRFAPALPEGEPRVQWASMDGA